MAKSQRHRAGQRAQEVVIALANQAALEAAKRQALTSTDNSGVERRMKVLEILADCDPEYCIGFLSGLISATVRKHWPAQHHQRVADDIAGSLKFVLSISAHHQ